MVGSSDKGIMLIDVSGKDSVKIKINDSAKQVLRIKTSSTLDVLKPDGHKGMYDPSCNNKSYCSHGSIKKPSNADLAFYAEDEGGKSDRNAKFGAISDLVFGSGDDLLYIITSNKSSDKNGNGALMLLDIK